MIDKRTYAEEDLTDGVDNQKATAEEASARRPYHLDDPALPLLAGRAQLPEPGRDADQEARTCRERLLDGALERGDRHGDHDHLRRLGQVKG